MKTKRIAVVALVALAFLTSRASAQVQPNDAGTPLVLPRPDYHFSGNVGRTYLDSAKPEFPQPVQAPKGAPNIVLILIDDAGFGQFSTFGGGIPSPTMDKLAAEGLRFNRFLRLPCAARLGPRSSPAATITRRRPALSVKSRPDTTATRRSFPGVTAASVKCCGRTGT